MPRINNPKPPKRAPKENGRKVKKKPCAFCQHGVTYVDYKDLNSLRKYISDRVKIRGRRTTESVEAFEPADEALEVEIDVESDAEVESDADVLEEVGE
jgi:ribosomal protein S18